MIDDDNVQQIKNYIQRSNEFLEILILILAQKNNSQFNRSTIYPDQCIQPKTKGRKKKKKKKKKK